MGEPATNINTKTSLDLITTVSGKITGKSTYEGKTRYLVMCPAADEYDYPSIVEIGSDNSTRQIGDVIKNAKVKIGGKRHTFTTRQGENVVTANMWLNEVV